ncbi:unnamed protein product [Peniophora sp. CBMAI 1063]|nr:unnamed protein product [Peniophora sp. CBMAI 1063]
MAISKDFTVAVIGGGLVGVLCAIALGRAGIKVDIFEAAHKYDEIGAGIGIGPNSVRVLKDMGIFDDFLAVSENRDTLPLITFVRGADPHDEILQYTDHIFEVGGYGLHRAAFLKALADLLPAGVVHSHFQKRCISIASSSNGRPRVHFADGSMHEADLIIGADGLKSAVRTQVFGERGSGLVDTGSRAYRQIIPMQRLLDAGIKEEMLRPKARIWLGAQDKYMIAYPIVNGTVLNVAAFTLDRTQEMVPANSEVPWLKPASTGELLSAFQDFGEEARAILGCMEAPNKWNLHALHPLPEALVSVAPDKKAANKDKPVSVVLVGDAAHAMLPHLGAGAGTGIEDAYVLTSLLTHPQTRLANLSEVLCAYDVVRGPRISDIMSRSIRAGDIYHGYGPSGATDEGRRRDLDAQWQPIWHHDLSVDVRQAVESLQRKDYFERE